ncbi:MAG TPA: hypothetical protein VF590_01965 [Isosphaeraceae bacterium]|jgi:hypothetical protein
MAEERDEIEPGDRDELIALLDAAPGGVIPSGPATMALLSRLTLCNDPLPARACDRLAIPPGSSYADAARELIGRLSAT